MHLALLCALKRRRCCCPNPRLTALELLVGALQLLSSVAASARCFKFNATACDCRQPQQQGCHLPALQFAFFMLSMCSGSPCCTSTHRRVPASQLNKITQHSDWQAHVKQNRSSSSRGRQDHFYSDTQQVRAAHCAHFFLMTPRTLPWRPVVALKHM